MIPGSIRRDGQACGGQLPCLALRQVYGQLHGQGRPRHQAGLQQGPLRTGQRVAQVCNIYIYR